MNNLGRFYVVQPVANSFYSGDEGFGGNPFGVEDDERSVHSLVCVELNVRSCHSGKAIKFLSDFGDACDFTHHSRNGQLGNCFFSCASAVEVLHRNVALRAARNQDHPYGQSQGD